MEDLKVELIPQAVLRATPEYFGRFGRLVSAYDDFDFFEGAAFSLNGKTPFKVAHYRGHPRNTVTIYLDHAIRDVDQITKIIAEILTEFDLPARVIEWQRKDNPDV